MSALLRCQDCGFEFEAKRSDTKRCSDCSREHKLQYIREYDHGIRRSVCVDCGADIGARAQRCVPCGNKHKVSKYVGNNNPNWKDGRVVDKHGYIHRRVKTGTPGVGKGAFYRPEHVIIWEQFNGPISDGWVVHHLNGVKDDNRIENLAGMPRNEHHSHPREALRPYEKRIKELEEELKRLEF